MAKNKYLRLMRIASSAKVDTLGREARMDQKLGYKTIPINLSFGTLEDKNYFREETKALGMTSKDSFPKIYTKQKEACLQHFRSTQSNPDLFWVKAVVRLGRPEAPVQITVKARKADSTEKWTVRGQVRVLPTTRWGDMDDEARKNHIRSGFNRE